MFKDFKRIINRPGVAGAVLQTPPSLIDSSIHPLWKYLQTIITSKPLELGTWNVDTMFTIPYVSHMSRVMCHVSHVTCHVSHVTCHMSCVTCHVSHVTKKNLKKCGGASRWRVCYQQGLPRLVLFQTRVRGSESSWDYARLGDYGRLDPN